MSERKQTLVPGFDLPPTSLDETAKATSPTRNSHQASNTEQNGADPKTSNNSSAQSSNGSTPTSSAAPGQRPLSMTRATSSANENSSDVNRPSRQKSGPNIPQWPVSPRLKSPPPMSSKTMAARRAETEMLQSNNSMRRLAPVSNLELGAMMKDSQDSPKETSTAQLSTRTLSRGVNSHGGALETVAEGSIPVPSVTRPSLEHDEKSRTQASSTDTVVHSTLNSSTNKDTTKSGASEAAVKTLPERAETAPSSRSASSSRPAANLAKRSVTNLTGKSKPAVEPLRSITVETEPVNSVSQMLPDRGRDGGSVRTKTSTETIRPKKDKRKVSRKTPSLHAGTNSSKADIFEAKVASAVDEADSSDSDETFVYESNPPDARHSRHHSRTPSSTSLASQADQYGTRGKHGVRSSTNNTMGGKKSMKFSNSIHSNQLEPESTGDSRGSTRTTSSTPRHHHIGRHGRNVHGSIIDTTSPFTQANRGTSPRSPGRLSRPNSPRASNGRTHFARKSANGGYDMYENGVDDERAPLMGSVRVSRNRYGRRPNSSHFRAMHFTEEEDPGCWPRYGGCCLIGLLATLLCVGVVILVVILNRPLMDVEILHIQNVLASESELMLDLDVKAVNPNLFTITVNDLDVNIFAESPYVGTSLQWAEQPRPVRVSFAERRRQAGLERRQLSGWFPPFGTDDGVDEGTDPDDDGDDDPETGAQKMLLGRIFDFDSPLSFSPSPIHMNPSSSVGEIRLTRPGNKTEVGGSARWERVLQHSFDLIVRGVIQYQLPLSSTIKSAKIERRISVAPGGDSDGDDDDHGGNHDKDRHDGHNGDGVLHLIEYGP